jgi:hypothetical protein
MTPKRTPPPTPSCALGRNSGFRRKRAENGQKRMSPRTQSCELGRETLDPRKGPKMTKKECRIQCFLRAYLTSPWWLKLASQSFHSVSFQSIIIQQILAPQIFWLFFLPWALVS